MQNTPIRDIPKWWVELDGPKYTTIEAPTVQAALEIVEREHGVGSVVEIFPVVAGDDYG